MVVHLEVDNPQFRIFSDNPRFRVFPAILNSAFSDWARPNHGSYSSSVVTLGSVRTQETPSSHDSVRASLEVGPGRPVDDLVHWSPLGQIVVHQFCEMIAMEYEECAH